MSRENKEAFSLFELIVAIATLSLLMGILIPALATTRAQAKQIQYGANIRQLLFANIAYANSNNDYYAPQYIKTHPKYTTTLRSEDTIACKVEKLHICKICNIKDLKN